MFKDPFLSDIFFYPFFRAHSKSRGDSKIDCGIENIKDQFHSFPLFWTLETNEKYEGIDV